MGHKVFSRHLVCLKIDVNFTFSSMLVYCNKTLLPLGAKLMLRAVPLLGLPCRWQTTLVGSAP